MSEIHEEVEPTLDDRIDDMANAINAMKGLIQLRQDELMILLAQKEREEHPKSVGFKYSKKS